MTKLKIFSGKSYLPPHERHVITLYPFWGLLPEPAGDKDTGRFDEYTRRGKDFFEMVPSLEEADIAVLPFEWKSRNAVYAELAQRLAREASKYGKRVVIFFNNDSDEAIPIENAVIFRTSFYRSRREPHEFSFPGWSVDFVSRYYDGRLPVRRKGKIPVVGYCGYLDYDFRSPTSLLKHGIRKLLGKQINPGAPLRGRAVRTLWRDKRIQLNFVCRPGFMGPAGEQDRLEYVQNIINSDYALVARGAGNFSYRLYEVLSCGRIPVFIDTDCVLPFDHLIDWRQYCIWIEASELHTLGDKIVAFHSAISSLEFEKMQRSVRNLYEEWISPVGFYKNLWRCIMA